MLIKNMLLMMLLLSVSVNAEDNSTTGGMFELDITTPNVLLIGLMIVLSLFMIIKGNDFGMVIAGGVILFLVSSMIMFSFNPYIGLMMMLGTVLLIFEYIEK